MKIRELISEGFAEYDGAEDALDLVANYVFRKTEKSDYFPLIVEEVRKADRHRVRGIERSVFDTTVRPANVERSTVPKAYASFSDRVENASVRFLRENLFVPGGLSTTWGEATVDAHLARAEYLRRMAAGNIDTAVRHEKAAALLQEKGATRLNELDESDLEGLL